MALIKEFRKTGQFASRHRPPHKPGKPILKVDELSVRYESGAALERVSFELHQGERVAVIGPNGAGKSTLFKVVAGVLPASEGEVSIYGQEPGGHICVAYLPQRTQVDWNFPVTVYDVVMMGRIGKMGLLRWPNRTDREHVRRALEMVGLLDLAGRQISQLSGGQQQRMFIARALGQEAELVLMDEPLNGLDIRSQETIFAILSQLHQEGVTVMVATHDLDLAADRFDRVMLLNHRLVSIGLPGEVITPENLVSAYGGRLHVLKAGENLIALDDSCCEEGEEHHHA